MCRDSPDMVPRLRSRSQAAPKLSQLTQGTEPAARPREARHPRKGRARQLAVPASSSPVELVVPVKQAAPLAGGAAAQHVIPGYQACTFFVSQVDRPISGG